MTDGSGPPEGCARLGLGSQGTVAIVLDGSESAQPHRDAILEWTLKLAGRLPVGTQGKLFFLGNRREYDLAMLAKNASRWWAENSNRGSFITPILTRVDASHVVVIGSGVIFDLEDWSGTREAARLTLLRAGPDSLQGNQAAFAEFDALEPALGRVGDSVQQVVIHGDGFMPYYWSNAGYTLSFTPTGVALVAEGPKDPSVYLRFFGHRVKARMTRRDGEEECPLESVEDADVADEEWKALGKDEAESFRSAAQGQDFTCPTCGEQHPATTVVCSGAGSILRKCVYPSLARPGERDSGGRPRLVLLRDDGQKVYYRVHPVDAVRMGPGAVAVVEDRTAVRYEYDGGGRAWVKRAAVGPYADLGSAWLLVVPHA